MKHQLPPSRSALSLFAGGEKKRFLFLSVCLVFVVGALGVSLYQGQKRSQPVASRTIEDESVVAPVPVAVPPLDTARLNAIVGDSNPADRVVLESAAADLMIDVARRYTPRHFQALEAPEIDAQRIATIESDPAAARGQPFTAHGRLVALRPRTGVVGAAQWLGTLELADEVVVHFLTLELPPGAETVGGFMRLDGLFLKRFKVEDQVQAGLWIEGPLLVGPRVVTSYQAFGPVTELASGPFLDVEDADISPEDGSEPRFVGESSSQALWYLMAFARDEPDQPNRAIDWEVAPLLDQRLLDRLVEEPETWRAQPIRIPISRLQDGRVMLAGENPARIERYTQGWIGNTTWRNVIRFRSPVLRPDLHIGDLVQGRGYFLHAFTYESSEHGLRIAPMFVLESLDQFHPKTSPILQRIPWVVAGIGILLTVLFVVLTRRDGKQSSQLYQELVQRRRRRRAKASLDAGPAAR